MVEPERRGRRGHRRKPLLCVFNGRHVVRNVSALALAALDLPHEARLAIGVGLFVALVAPLLLPRRPPQVVFAVVRLVPVLVVDRHFVRSRPPVERAAHEHVDALDLAVAPDVQVVPRTHRRRAHVPHVFGRDEPLVACQDLPNARNAAPLAVQAQRIGHVDDLAAAVGVRLVVREGLAPVGIQLARLPRSLHILGRHRGRLALSLLGRPPRGVEVRPRPAPAPRRRSASPPPPAPRHRAEGRKRPMLVVCLFARRALVVSC